jgi:hypothetical protein
MATITFDSGDVWDNTASGSTYDAKFTTKIGPGVGQLASRRFLTNYAAFRGISGDVPATRLSLITGKVSFDSSYPTGGEDATVISAMMPHGVVLACIIEPAKVAACASEDYDITNKKIKCYSTAATEVVNTTNLAAVVNLRFIAIGY